MAQDDFLQFQERVKQAESRGRRYDKNGNLLTSPKGAQGEMQVMPATQRSPGFGITPAKDRSPEEIARVGTDYLATMKKRYGDETLAAIAYNMGPGATDKWLAAGADFSKLPAETQGYVQKVMGKTPSAPATASAPASQPTPSEQIVEPALRSGMTASAEDLGSGYKAALALSFLGADEADKPESDDDLQARLDKEEEDTAAAELAAYKPKNAFADLQLSAKSHLQAMNFADGGDVVSNSMPLNPNPMAGTPEMMLWHGGVVHRADGSPMGGENVDHLTPQEIERMAEAQRPAFVTPGSGRNRQQGPISQALNSGTAYPAMARGVAELPYDIAGAPVDLATMAMRPFGYSTEKPAMGSDWIKEKMTSLGVRPGPESDPTLAGFRTAGELGANLVNPAAVARRVGPAVEQGAKAVGRAAGEAMNERMLSGQSIVPGMGVPPPVAFAVPPGPSMGTVAAVTPENQFVGRLDNFVATMKNPVRKDQLIAQISKNFREYDVGRLETALADIASDAKLTPAQITERLSTTYNPNKFRTTVIEPSEQTRGSFYQGMDNPYYDPLSGNGPPLGVIHMSLQGTPEQQAAQQVAKDTSEAFRRLLRASANPDEIQMVRGFLQTPEFNALPNARELSNKFDTGIKQSEKINDYMKEVSELDNKLRYPVLSADYQPIFDAKMEQYRGQMPWEQAYDRAQMETHHALIDKANEWLTKNGYQGLSGDTLRSIQGKKSPADDENFITAVKDAIDPVEVMVMKAHDNLKNYLKAPVYEVNQALAKDLPYTGQHTSLKNESNPIAFSRFSAHTIDIPGIGEAKGIYVNELQSDLLDDLRKMGKKGGSKEKDIKEIDRLGSEIDYLRQQMNDALAAGKGAQAEDLSKQIDGAKKRLRTIESRARVGTYDVPEAIHNMENLPQVTQQLMAKNVIGAAIQRGDQFVAFPGKESAQAQLYEKLPYNLKQVVKDLGPGFEIRPIELDSPQGKMMHTAVVWGPEAAARIKKTGVPFKDGGAVERITTDNRRYL